MDYAGMTGAAWHPDYVSNIFNFDEVLGFL
jgi:hypothetical protein